MNAKRLRPQSLNPAAGNPARWILSAAGAALLCIAPAAMAVTLSVVDLAKNTIQSSPHFGKDARPDGGGFINGTVFERGVPVADSGQFRLRFSPPDRPGSGYQTGSVARSKSPKRLESVSRVQDSAETVEGGLYELSLLANGSSRRKIKQLSLNMFGLQMGGVTDPAPLPASQTNPGPAAPGAVAHDTFAGNEQSEVPRWTNAGGSPGGATLQIIQPVSIPEPGVSTLALLGGILTLTGRRRGR